MIDKFLPVGTVVLLKEGKKRLMITGYLCQDSAQANKVYDYSGCLYPEGILTLEKIYMFDHEQIEHIFFTGYKDDEANNFIEKLKDTTKTESYPNSN